MTGYRGWRSPRSHLVGPPQQLHHPSKPLASASKPRPKDDTDGQPSGFLSDAGSLRREGAISHSPATSHPSDGACTWLKAALLLSRGGGSPVQVQSRRRIPLFCSVPSVSFPSLQSCNRGLVLGRGGQKGRQILTERTQRLFSPQTLLQFGCEKDAPSRISVSS